MSVTVQDCLRLPSFHSARVIAGKNGLGRIVSSVSVIEIPAKSVEAISVFNPNELLVTSFYSIKDDPTRQCEEMRNLYDAGGVALVLFYVSNVCHIVWNNNTCQITASFNIICIKRRISNTRHTFSINHRRQFNVCRSGTYELCNLYRSIFQLFIFQLQPIGFPCINFGLCFRYQLQLW